MIALKYFDTSSHNSANGRSNVDLFKEKSYRVNIVDNSYSVFFTIGVIDLDRKSVKKLQQYYELDRMVVSHFVSTADNLSLQQCKE